MKKLQTFILGTMRTNCYFISDEATSTAAVVDPADECDKILNKISERGLTVTRILLTHGHYDHMLALEELRNATGALVCVHSLDAPALTNPDISYMRRFGGKRSIVCRPADLLLSDGDTIKIGETELDVLHTPGHTVGSVCYLCKNLLISGDTLFRDDVGRWDLYGGDYKTLLSSLARLRGLPGDYAVYPGHGSSTTLSHERENNPYLAENPPDEE